MPRNKPSAAPLPSTPVRFIRIKEVMYLTSLGRSTIHAMVSRQAFPRQRKLTASTRSTAPAAWLESDVRDWISARVAAAQPV
jgi:prophage regulatory protein